MSLLGTKSQHDISDKQSSIIRGYPRSTLLKPTSGGSPESVHGKFTAEPMVTSCSNGPIVVPLQTLVPIHNMHWGAADPHRWNSHCSPVPRHPTWSSSSYKYTTTHRIRYYLAPHFLTIWRDPLSYSELCLPLQISLKLQWNP